MLCIHVLKTPHLRDADWDEWAGSFTMHVLQLHIVPCTVNVVHTRTLKIVYIIIHFDVMLHARVDRRDAVKRIYDFCVREKVKCSQQRQHQRFYE